MDKKVVGLLAALMLALWTGTALGAAAAEKIGFVDVREVMMSSDAGKKATAEFNKIYESNKAIIQGRESELQKLKDEMDKQKSVLTEAALKEKETSYQNKFREYQGLLKQANDDLQKKNMDVAKTMIPEIQKLISAIGEKEKYTVIFDVSAQPIPYYSKATDLTKRVMEEFNKTYKPKK